MTEREYREAEGINKSTLWEMRRSPAHYKYLIDHPREDTPALHFGRALHAAVLTPAAYKREFVVAPAVDKRTKAGREEYAAWKERLPEGVEEITPEDAETIADMVKSIKSNPDAIQLLKRTSREVPLFWKDKKSGLKCKCRVDALGEDAIIDIKTTNDIMSFERDAEAYGYHVQAAHYLQGVQAKRGKLLDWYFIAVEKKAPYGVKVLRATSGFLDYGEFVRDELLEKVKECREKGVWPCYQAGEIAEPRWINWEGL